MSRDSEAAKCHESRSRMKRGGGVMDRKQQPWQKGKGRLDGRAGGKMAKGQERRGKFNRK